MTPPAKPARTERDQSGALSVEAPRAIDFPIDDLPRAIIEKRDILLNSRGKSHLARIAVRADVASGCGAARATGSTGQVSG